MDIRDRHQAEKAARPQAHPPLAIKRIAVVARDSKSEITTGSGRFRDPKRGFEPHIQEVIRVASDHDADVILFSLWSHNAGKLGELNRSTLFPPTTNHSAVILGVTRESGKDNVEAIEVWFLSHHIPFVLSQRFGRTTAPRMSKERLISDFASRRFGHTLILLCGEVNIIRTRRSKPGVVDDFRFLPRLRGAGIEYIFNPIHSYMRRYEMGLKREALAKAAGTLISVWNRGLTTGSESKTPWAVYRDGKTITNAVREIELPIPSQPGIRIGIIDGAK